MGGKTRVIVGGKTAGVTVITTDSVVNAGFVSEEVAALDELHRARLAFVELSLGFNVS